MRNTVLFISIIAMITIIPAECFSNQNHSHDNCSYKIIFWGTSVLDMEKLHESTYDQLILKYKPMQIICDKYISKYYWDEQLIEFEFRRYLNENDRSFKRATSGLFTIVLYDKIICHGISRLSPFGPIMQKYDDSNFPAIINHRSLNPNIMILALKPKLFPYLNKFRSYEHSEQRRIMNTDVLKYFDSQEKTVRGKIELNSIIIEEGEHIDDIDKEHIDLLDELFK